MSSKAGSSAQERLAYDQYTCLTPGNFLLLAYQPKVYVSLCIAVPCGLIGGAIRYNNNQNGSEKLDNFLKDGAVFSMLTILVTFLAAFRVSAAYQKFWDGCSEVYNIIGSFNDCVSDLVAFSRNSRADPKEVEQFHHLVVRLISLLNSLMFANLECGKSKSKNGQMPTAYDFELIDVGGIDPAAMDRLLDANDKVEVVSIWISNLIIEAWHKKIFSVEPPLMGRPLGDFSEALVHYRNAQRITEVPFPFPFSLALQLLLITHWLMTPLVVSSWTEYTVYAIAFCFGGSFSLWFFIALAMELDTPFAATRNSLDMRYCQQLLNHRMMTAIEVNTKPQPKLSENVKKDLSYHLMHQESGARESFGEMVKSRTLELQ